MNARRPSHLWTLVLSCLTFGIDACDEKKPSPTDNTSTSSSASAASPTSTTPSVTATPAVTPAAAASDTKPPPDSITAQHVLITYKGAKSADPAITRSKADAKKRAEEVATKAKSGSDFSALVAEYSDDPTRKDRRGSLGKFTREKMTKPFSDAAFALRPDETSGVVETEFGFHVIKRND